MQGIAGECQGNERERVPSARGMQGNTGECWRMPGVYRVMYGIGCKVPAGECQGKYVRGCKGNVGECRGMSGECRGMSGECRGMPEELMEVGAKCQKNAVKCQGNVRELVQRTRGMQGNAGECRMPGERMGVGAKCQGDAGE